MGLFDWLKGLFGAKPGETPDDVADRIERAGDRFGNAGDTDAARAAEIAAADARRCATAEEARRIEQEFYRSRGLRPDGRPVRPVVGSAGNRGYVRYGSRVRSGGSMGWRYNNPGYLRCGERATYYGAIGCDGTYAIFPDEYTGSRAFVRHLRHEYPQHTVGDAIRQQLPPQEAEAAAARLHQAGIDLGAAIGAIGDAELGKVADGCREAAAAEPGDVFEQGGAAPDWVESVWSVSPAGTDASGSDFADPAAGASPTDNS